MTRREGGTVRETLTNAMLTFHYLGDGRWFAVGSGQLSQMRFEVSTLDEMSRGPLPVPPPPSSKPFNNLGLPYPQLSIIEDATGQPQSFPNPLALAEVMLRTGDYESWHRRMRNPEDRLNILGYGFDYALETSTNKPYNAVGLLGGLSIIRPDGTRLAMVSAFDRGWRSGDISVFDETGSNVTCKLAVRRETSNSPFQITRVNRSAGAVLAFGPVVERVVNDGADGFGRDMYLDLDTGGLMSYPKNQHFRDPELGRHWLAANGLEVQAMNQAQAWTNGLAEAADRIFFDQSRQRLPTGPLKGIFISDAHIVRLADAQWDSLAPDTLTTSLALQPSNAISYFSATGVMPVTLGFKTREGGMGILQITGFTDDPRGVKLHHKLVQNGGTPNPKDEVMRIQFEDVRFTAAIEQLAAYLWLNYVVDLAVLIEQAHAPLVTVNWENLTVTQVLTALLESRNLELIPDPQTGIARITARSSVRSAATRPGR